MAFQQNDGTSHDGSLGTLSEHARKVGATHGEGSIEASQEGIDGFWDSSHNDSAATLRRRKRNDDPGNRMAYILSESFHLLDSYRPPPHENEEIQDSATAHQQTRRAGHARQEPFISSLVRSFHIVQRSRTWINSRRDENGSFHYLRANTRLVVHTALHISVYAVLGGLFRIFLAHLFSGGDCISSSTPSSESGWVSVPQWLLTVQKSANLCIATDSAYDNAVFANLPANLLGCFLMGLWQASSDLGLATLVPIASLPERHFFQQWTLHHVGLRTGFCGSLTTLASWNSQVVRLADGWAFSGSGGSQLAVAVLACVLGLQGAVSSFRLGQEFAIWVFRFLHPHWAREEDMLAFAFAKGSPEYDSHGQGGDHHRLQKTPLTDYERHYLAFLIPQQEYHIAEQNVSALEDLEKWKISTDEFRLQVGSVGNIDEANGLIRILHNLERHVLMDSDQDLAIPDSWKDAVEENGWDLAALRSFAQKVHIGTGNAQGERTDRPLSIHQRFFQAIVSSIPFVLALALLAFCILMDYYDMNRQYYRELWAAAVLSPVGAILRWKLSSWNGRLRGTSWMWFPLGTFTANVTACIVSVALTALEDAKKLQAGNASVLAFALKAGLAGCLSTVSSYVAEGSSLQKLYPHHAKGYMYLLGTLLLTFSTGLILYSPVVRL